MKHERAFPSEAYGNAAPHTGMTLRDYFAAKALEGICASQQTKMFADQDHLAKGAYLLADAMMEARNAAQ